MPLPALMQTSVRFRRDQDAHWAVTPLSSTSQRWRHLHHLGRELHLDIDYRCASTHSVRNCYRHTLNEPKWDFPEEEIAVVEVQDRNVETVHFINS